MPHRKAVFLFYLIVLPCILLAQIPTNSFSPVMTNDILNKDKSKNISQTQSPHKNVRSFAADSHIGIITLPVVVHIIHDNGSENISNQQIASAIAQLNNGFRHSINGFDMQIAFCLAKQDPDRNPSSGINRIQSALTSETMETDDHALKQLSFWDPTRYINVWIVRSVNSNVIGQKILGYATMPVSHGSIDDGIVIEAGCFASSAELSRVMIHNFGHYLGLYHTFEAGCKYDDSLLDDELISNTPPYASAQSTSCNATISRCNADYDDLSIKNPFRLSANDVPGDQPYLTTLTSRHNDAPGRTNSFSVTTSFICGTTACDDIHITFNKPYINAGPDITICRDEQTILKGEGAGSCTWFDASMNQIGTSWELPVRPLSSTFYVLKVQGERCSSTDTVIIAVTPVCEGCAVDAGQNQTICNGQTTILQAATNGHCTRNNCSSRIPVLTCANGCSSTLTGAISANVNQGQTACIPAGTSFTGRIAINGGTLIVCGYANPSNITFSSGRIIVSGAADFSSLPIGRTLENYGDIYIKNDCTVTSTGELQNYGYLIVDGSFYSNRRTSNYSTFIVSDCFSQNGADIFTNECTFSIGSDLQSNGTLINNGSITVNGTGYLNSGSQLIADDGSILSVKNIYFNSHVDGGSAGYSSVTVEQNTFINSEAVLEGLLDICDKNGIELNSGSLVNTLTTDCRCVTDNHGGTASFVWTDQYGKTVGFGKQILVKPVVSTIYTVTATDVNGNRASDEITVEVDNCN